MIRCSSVSFWFCYTCSTGKRNHRLTKHAAEHNSDQNTKRPGEVSSTENQAFALTFSYSTPHLLCRISETAGAADRFNTT
jgi:hypothetical protein